MRKIVKAFLCFTICFSVLLSLLSCGLFDRNQDGIEHEWHEGCIVPEGYTGGVITNRNYHMTYENKWLETYDEFIDAVTLLNSNGSKLPQIPIFNCEEYGIDIKFRFSFQRNLAEELKEGQGYFDRKIDHVSITFYAFFEDVSIEKLEYSLVELYDAVYISRNGFADLDVKTDSLDGVEDIDVSINKLTDRIAYSFSYNEKKQIILLSTYETFRTDVVTQDHLEIFAKTIEIIG